MSDFSLETLLLIWVAAGLGVLAFRRRGEPRVGLVGAYFVGLALIHWSGGALYLNESYFYYSPAAVRSGFELATIGVVGFALGCMLFAPVLRRLILPRLPKKISASAEPWVHKLAISYLAIGLVSFFFLGKILGRLPSLGALSAGWRQLLVVGICLGLWWAMINHDRKKWVRWSAVALALPLLTTVFEGFLGFGTLALVTICTFVLYARPFRVRWIPILLVVMYLGLSLFVTYASWRDQIRLASWHQQNYAGTFRVVLDALDNFQFFDIADEAHLRAVDDRLNQNWLVGEAVERIERGHVEPAHGGTLLAAALAPIPRALWPNKPITAGSGDLVSYFTGIGFAEGTSVGVGQVMEFYINFGELGVFLGFLILGVLISYFDFRAGYALHLGDHKGFTLWFLAGIGFLQAGGSLVEVTSSVAAGIIAALIVNRLLSAKHRPRLQPGNHSWRSV